MTFLRRYTTSNLSNLIDEIWNNSPVDYHSSRYYRRDRWVPLEDSRGRLEIELAGFTKGQIEVFTQSNALVVTAKNSTDKHIRDYYNSWVLGEHEVVDKVKYENGLLSIEILKVIPEEKKRVIHRIE